MPTTTQPPPAAKSATSAQSAANRPLLLQPYVFFDGRCEEAIEFYRRAIGAEVVMLARFKDSPPSDGAGDCQPPPGIGEKIMHATLRVGGTELLVSDGHAKGQPKFEGFSLSLTVPTEAEAQRFFNALGDGGQVQMPLTKTFFSPSFGMVADRYGVSWMIYVKPVS